MGKYAIFLTQETNKAETRGDSYNIQQTMRGRLSCLLPVGFTGADVYFHSSLCFHSLARRCSTHKVLFHLLWLLAMCFMFEGDILSPSKETADSRQTIKVTHNLRKLGNKQNVKLNSAVTLHTGVNTGPDPLRPDPVSQTIYAT